MMHGPLNDNLLSFFFLLLTFFFFYFFNEALHFNWWTPRMSYSLSL